MIRKQPDASTIGPKLIQQSTADRRSEGGLGPWLLGAVVAVGLLGALLMQRILEQPLQPFGTAKVPFVQHGIRLRALARIHQMDTAAPAEAYRILDGDYAVGGKIVALLWGEVFGHQVDAVLVLGLLWMCLLACFFAATARTLGASWRGTISAALFVMLLPSVHGPATIYYYDLPATALIWVSVWIILRFAHERPVRAGLCGALVFAAACLTKWAALPFGLPVVGGALLCGAATDRRAAMTRVLTFIPVVVCVLATALFVDDESLRGNFSSQQAPVTDAGNPLGLRGQFSDIPLRVGYASVQFVTALLSPLLALFLVPLAFLWAWRDRRGLALILLGAAGTLCFTLVVAADADERFLLPAALSLTLAAALALDRLLPARFAAILVASFVVVGLGVAWDFHHARPGLWNQQVLLFSLGEERPTARLRGLGAVSSVEALGWNRRDETPDVPDLLLAAVDAAFGDQPDASILVSSGAAALGIHSVWFEYAHLLAWLDDRAGPIASYPKTSPACPLDAPAEADALLVAVDEDFPGCLSLDNWQLEQRLSGRDRELHLYRPKLQPPAL